uniref:Uncharacterized protein n=1 Tax=Manihot esculenta TaxID=3983 RepID=A0A2C9V6F6_MANES
MNSQLQSSFREGEVNLIHYSATVSFSDRKCSHCLRKHAILIDKLGILSYSAPAAPSFLLIGQRIHCCLGCVMEDYGEVGI